MPAVRLALAVAVLLAVGASFGLHPEPASAAPIPNGDALRISAARSAAAPHDCLACLTHGAAIASPLAGIVLEAEPSSPLGLPEGPLSPVRLTCRDLSGRSPPARS